MISLIIGAASYIVTSFPNIRANLLPLYDVQVLAWNPVVIANYGDRPVFVREVQVLFVHHRQGDEKKTDSINQKALQILQLIKPDEIYRTDQYITKDQLPSQGTIRVESKGVDSKEWEVNPDVSKIKQALSEDRCYDVAMESPDTVKSQTKAFGEETARRIFFPVEVQITFSPNSGSRIYGTKSSWFVSLRKLDTCVGSSRVTKKESAVR